MPEKRKNRIEQSDKMNQTHNDADVIQMIQYLLKY